MKQSHPLGLRLGLIGPLPPPTGGMAMQTQQLKTLLESEGIAVTLVQVNAPYSPAWVERLRGLRALFRLLPYLAKLWRTAGQVQLFHVMANSGWAWHLFAAPAIWIGRWRGIPVLVNYRGGEAEAFMARSAALVLPSLRKANVLAVPSGFLQAVFGKFGIAAEIVPNIVDLTRFRPSEASGDAAACIVVARNLEPIYDNATALRAFALVHQRFPSASLLIAGSGPERQALEELSRQLGIAEGVEFTGRLDRDGMAGLYRRATVALNPSLVDNMPNSVLEALASGVPVVSTAVGGVPFIVQDGVTALLVPPADPEAMARAILRLLEDPRLAGDLRQAGLSEVRQYAWPAVKERLLSLYLHLAGQTPL